MDPLNAFSAIGWSVCDILVKRSNLGRKSCFWTGWECLFLHAHVFNRFCDMIVVSPVRIAMLTVSCSCQLKFDDLRAYPCPFMSWKPQFKVRALEDDKSNLAPLIGPASGRCPFGQPGFGVWRHKRQRVTSSGPNSTGHEKR